LDQNEFQGQKPKFNRGVLNHELTMRIQANQPFKQQEQKTPSSTPSISQLPPGLLSQTTSAQKAGGNWFKITEKHMEELKNKIADHQLRSFKTLNNQTFSKQTLRETLKKLKFDEKEILIIITHITAKSENTEPKKEVRPSPFMPTPDMNYQKHMIIPVSLPGLKVNNPEKSK
jgi:hypothetical protein